MKVLIVSNMGPKLSAPLQGSFIDKQVDRLKNNGLDTSYFWLKWNGDSLIHKLFKYPVFFISFFINYILSTKKYDIIHIHYYFPTIICAFLYKISRNRKVKVIVTCHGSDIYSYTPPNFLYKKLSFVVEHWFFTSEKLYERFYRKLDNKTILCAGYDDSIFSKENIDTFKDIDCLFIGSLDKNKGIDRLQWLVEKLPNIKFTVVGSGPLENDLMSFSVMNRNLLLKGQQTPIEIAHLLKQSKMLLSLSRNESFGLVMTEAHACMTPCVVTETDGSLAQLKSWPYIVVQDNNEQVTLEQLKKNILTVLNLNATTYKEIQYIAHKNSEDYSLSSVVDILEQRYMKLYSSSNSNTVF
jgi:glycosyltransferase involved in cell wall biosynthesis